MVQDNPKSTSVRTASLARHPAFNWSGGSVGKEETRLRGRISTPHTARSETRHFTCAGPWPPTISRKANRETHESAFPGRSHGTSGRQFASWKVTHEKRIGGRCFPRTFAQIHSRQQDRGATQGALEGQRQKTQLGSHALYARARGDRAVEQSARCFTSDELYGQRPPFQAEPRYLGVGTSSWRKRARPAWQGPSLRDQPKCSFSFGFQRSGAPGQILPALFPVRAVP